MSKVFEYYLEQAENKLEEILSAYKSNKITREEAIRQMLADDNIKTCLLDNRTLDTEDIINELLDDPYLGNEPHKVVNSIMKENLRHDES